MNNLIWKFDARGRTESLSVGGVDLLATKAVKSAELTSLPMDMAELTVKFIVRDIPAKDGVDK